MSFTWRTGREGRGSFRAFRVRVVDNPAMCGRVVDSGAVAVGAGHANPTRGFNRWSDTGTPASSTDLARTKDDGSATYTAGTAISYTIVVSNLGPSNAVGASVADVVPASITGESVNCVASGTAVCWTNAPAGNHSAFPGANIQVGAGKILRIPVARHRQPAEDS